MIKPRMIGTILANGFGNTSGGPVLAVWTAADSTRSAQFPPERIARSAVELLAMTEVISLKES
jgi:hypothetical protein